MTIKGQALANFIVEFTYSNTTKVASTIGNAEALKGVEMKKGRTSTIENENFDDAERWLYVDGASNKNGLVAGIMLTSPEGHKIHCTLRFSSKHRTMKPNTKCSS